MTSKRSPARLVIALSIAGMLAVFLLYTSIAGGGTVSLQPSELAAYRGEEVRLAGRVAGVAGGDAHGGGLRFTVRDIGGTKSVPVLYKGSVPDLFRQGRDVVVTGTLRGDVFVAKPGTLVTKCPSKYTAKKET